MIEILLPRTDAGVVAQLVVLAVASPIALAATWRNTDLRTFVVGVTVLTLGWMALRTAH